MAKKMGGKAPVSTGGVDNYSVNASRTSVDYSPMHAQQKPGGSGPRKTASNAGRAAAPVPGYSAHNLATSLDYKAGTGHQSKGGGRKHAG